MLKLDLARIRRFTGIIAHVVILTKCIYYSTHLYVGVQLISRPQIPREVSYSRNVFLPITNMCRNFCSYCGFRREPSDGAWFMDPEEVIMLSKRAKAAGCSEALLTLGERPEFHAEAKEKLERLGHKSTVDYLVDLCRKILELGLLPHTNAGLLTERELKLLRRYNASMGLMLECTVQLPAHVRSPGKDPKLRLEMIKAAGRLRIPFTTGLLIGIGESPADRVQSLLAIQRLYERYDHIQEIIIQPFAPKPNTPMQNWSAPKTEEVLSTVAIARSMMPEMNIQVPPNLVTNVRHFLLAGANDLGGISILTHDFINPEHPWPSVAELRAEVERAGLVPRERLPIYPRYALDAGFMSREVKERVLELAGEDGYRAC